MGLVESQYTTTAGELFVAHKLAMLGLVTAFVRNGVRGVDLLVSNNIGSPSIPVQICSVPSATRDLRRATPLDGFTLDFPLSQRAVESAAESAIFCFVDLMMRVPDATPEVYVVPAAVLKRDFAGIRARRYTTARYRRSRQAMEYYRNNWRPFLDALQIPPAKPKSRHPVVDGQPVIMRAAVVPLVPPERQQVSLATATADTNS